MGAENAELYILRPAEETDAEGESGWVSPQPADDVIIEAVADAVGDSTASFDDLDSYVDLAALAAVFEGDEDEVTFDVDGHEVTVDESGTIDVESN